MTARAVRGARPRWSRRWLLRPARRRSHAARPRRDSTASTGSSASTTPSSKRASTRSTPSCAARLRPGAAPKPATCSPPPRSGGGSCSIPRAARSTTSSRRAVERAIAHHRSVDRARARRRRGLVLPRRRLRRAGPVARAARREARRRARRQAHQAGARARHRARSRRWTMPTSASGMYRYYADVAPAAAKVLRFLLLLPGGDREGGPGADAARANPRAAAPGRSRLPAAHHLSLVRAADRLARSSCCESLRRALSRQSALPRADRRDPGRYQHDITASLATWRTLLAAAREQRVERAGARARSRRGSASRDSSRRSTRPTTRSSSCRR